MCPADRTQRIQLKEIRRTREQEPTLPLFSPNSGFDEGLGSGDKTMRSV